MKPVENINLQRFLKVLWGILKTKHIIIVTNTIITIACRICLNLQLSFKMTSGFVPWAVHYSVNNVPKYLQPEEEQQTEQTWPGRV